MDRIKAGTKGIVGLLAIVTLVVAAAGVLPTFGSTVHAVGPKAGGCPMKDPGTGRWLCKPTDLKLFGHNVIDISIENVDANPQANHKIATMKAECKNPVQGPVQGVFVRIDKDAKQLGTHHEVWRAKFDDKCENTVWVTFVPQVTASQIKVVIFDNNVGGIAELPEGAGTPLETDGSSGSSAGVLTGVIAGAALVGGVTLGGAAWYARRRLSSR